MIYYCFTSLTLTIAAIQDDMINADRMYVDDVIDITDLDRLCSRALGAAAPEFKVMIRSGKHYL